MRVLVSVNSVAEAQLVLAAGVSLIDLKDTSHGALSALSMSQSVAIMQAVNGYKKQHAHTDILVSATVGDTAESVAALLELIQSRLEIGVDIIKLPEAIWDHPLYSTVISQLLAAGTRMVAVFSPDSLLQTSTLELRLNKLATQGYVGVMVDTIDKSSSVLDCVSISHIQKFTEIARRLQLMVGVAGGLRPAYLAQLRSLEADFLGFRSGLCEKGLRQSNLLAEPIVSVVRQLSGNCCKMSA